MHGKCKLYVRVATPSSTTARATRQAKLTHLSCDINQTLSLPTTAADEEVIISVYEANLIGADTLHGTARVPLWTAITEGGQALTAPLLPPHSGSCAQPIGEVQLRLDFTVNQASQRRPPQQQQWQQQPAAVPQLWQQQQPPVAQQQWQEQPGRQAPAQPYSLQQPPQQVGWNQPPLYDPTPVPGWDRLPSGAAPYPVPGAPYPDAPAATAYPPMNGFGAQHYGSSTTAADSSSSQYPGTTPAALPNGVATPAAANGAVNATPASPYPQHPTTFVYQAGGGVAKAQPGSPVKQQQQQQWQQPPGQQQQQWEQPPGQQQSYQMQPGAYGQPFGQPYGQPYGQPGQPYGMPPQPQLPTMPVVYDDKPQGGGGLMGGLLGGGGGGGSKPAASGIGIGTAVLGGLAAGLALDALF